MQFFLLKPLVAVLAFVSGVIGVLYLAPLPSIQPVLRDDRSPAEVTVSELTRHPESYDGKLVRVTARLEFSGEGTATLSESGYPSQWIRASCGTGYESCADLLGDVKYAQPEEATITVTGRFFASVLERAPGGISARVSLIEISGTKGLEMKKAGRPFRTDSLCEQKRRRGEDCMGATDAVPPGHRYSNGEGHGSGYGSGNGNGTKPGGSAPGAGSGGGTL